MAKNNVKYMGNCKWCGAVLFVYDGITNIEKGYILGGECYPCAERERMIRMKNHIKTILDRDTRLEDE